MTPEERSELERWLAADPRHRGAYARARAWLRAVEQAATDRVSIAEPAPLSPLAGDNDNNDEPGGTAPRFADRRSPSWARRAAAGIGALAFGTALLLGLGAPLHFLDRPEQAGAEMQIVRLKDGSVATLSQDAEIRVVLSDSIRRITLLRGRATFEVAHDKARPFVVRSGDVYAQATGTVYSVSRVGRTGGAVQVTEGSVLVWPRDERDQAVLLHAGGTVTLDPGPAKAPRLAAPAGPQLPPPELAQISLDNVPIAEAAARFNRVNSTRIVIADPAIGDVEIIGIYRANEPEQFARAAAAITGAEVKKHNSTIVIKMK